MSTIVWVLTIMATGMYGIPTTVRVTFDTEAACEAAKATVVVARSFNPPTCEPTKKAKP